MNYKVDRRSLDYANLFYTKTANLNIQDEIYSCDSRKKDNIIPISAITGFQKSKDHYENI